MPTEELEHELRRAFAKTAASYQHDAELARQRLLRRAYRPGSGPRRRAAGLGAVAAAGLLVLGLGLSGALGSPTAHEAGTIRTAAFTLTRNPDGIETLTINKGELLEPSTLQNDLAQHGISVKVTIGSFCYSNPSPAGLSKDALSRLLSQVVQFRGVGSSYNLLAVALNPAVMPAGTKLSFGYFPAGNGYYTRITAFTLINPGSYTCSSIPPMGVSDGPRVIYAAGLRNK
jgi:hypothetical protein